MSWVAVAAALLTGLAVVGVVTPLMRRGTPGMVRLSSHVEDRRLQLLRTLHDLERDRARGALAEADYERLRRRTQGDAVALIRRLTARDASAELASALRLSRSPARARRTGERRSSILIATLVVGVVAAAAVPLMLSAIGERSPGGFITGTQPTAKPSNRTAASFERRVLEHPDDLEARLDLAQSYLEAGRPSLASRQYVEVLTRDPDNAEAMTRLGLLIYESGATTDALKVVDKVLASHPRYPEALFLKGVILLNGLNRPNEAIAPLKAYLEVAPFGAYRDDAQELLSEAEGAAR